MKEFIKVNKYYLITIILMLLTFILVKKHFSYELLTLDTSIHDKLLTIFHTDFLNYIMRTISFVGSVYFYIPLLILVLIKSKKYFKLISIPLIIAYLTNMIFKLTINRNRPLTWIVTPSHDPSFPSGHTVCSVVFYGIIVYLLKNIKNKNLRLFLRILLTILIILIGLSRLYLGVHFLSDVLAAYLLGLLVLIMFIKYYKTKNI